MIKKSNGITLISLCIVIVVMFIIASTTVSISLDRFEINNYNKMISDLELLDEKVFNLSRVARCCGYYNRKGTNADKERPQRLCEFVKVPTEFKVNPKEYFEKIAALYPEEVKPSRENNYSTERFNLDAFIEKYNIKISRKVK